MNNILKKATKNTNRKELAEDLGLTPKQVGRQINGEVKNGIIDTIKTYMDHTDNDLIIQHLAETAGGYFFREIKRGGSEDFKGMAEILKEFGEFLNVSSEAYADGKVTASELAKMKKEYGDLAGVAQGIFLGLEKELLK